MAITATTSFTSSSTQWFFQILIIAFVYLLVGIGSTSSWTLGGLFLQRIISNEGRVKIFNVVMALLIVLSVVPFIF